MQQREVAERSWLSHALGQFVMTSVFEWLGRLLAG